MQRTFDGWLGDLSTASGVSREVIGQVLYRIARSAPKSIPRVDIATGRELGDDLVRLSEGSVSRAARALLNQHMIEEEEQVVERPGRPLLPLRLSRDAWRCIGIHVRSAHGHPVELTGVITGLAGNVLASTRRALTAASEAGEVLDLVQRTSELIAELEHLAPSASKRSFILGVGVDIGGHVYAGTVIDSMNAKWMGVDLAGQLEAAVQIPVIVENDVNALAIWETHRRRYPEADIAVVAVEHEGVGGALITNGKLYRGGHGMAGEIGHLTVEYRSDAAAPRDRSARKKESSSGFGGQCPSPCPGYGHVDCLATPARIATQLGCRDLDDVVLAPRLDKMGHRTDAAATFARAGQALGRGLVDLINLVNPSRILLLLPEQLLAPHEDRAVFEYLTAVESWVDRAFSTGAGDARAGRERLTVHALSDVRDVDLPGVAAPFSTVEVVHARASAASVLDALLAHAAGKIRPAAPRQVLTDVTYKVPVADAS